MREMPKGRTKPLAWFERHFVDGADGRPEDLDLFVAGWSAFLRGFHWKSRADWTGRYVGRPGKPIREPWVYDRPTWHLQRRRAEPWFGQDQARLAGEVLREAGMRREAAIAWLWSLEVDEWRGPVAQALAEVLDELREEETAWLVRTEDARRRGDERVPAAPPVLRGATGRIGGLLDAWADAIQAYSTRGWTVAATALAADHDRVARLVGRPPVSLPIPAPPAVIERCRHPFDPAPRPVGLYGYVEDELTGHDTYRVPGLFFVEDDGDLHVGRKRPRSGTGTLDRTLHRRHSFVRTPGRQAAGRYLISTRIFFTTSYVRGAVVVGSGRRDRNVRFTFRAGDYLYSAGEKEEAARLEHVDWSIDGLRGRDGGLGGSAPRGRYKFDGERSSFVLELLVDGPELHAFVDGDWVGSHHTTDAQPIEGHVGFAVSWGAIRVQAPTVQRLDRSRYAGLYRRWPAGLDVTHDGDIAGESLLNRAARGIPRHPAGTLVVWIPGVDATDDGDPDVESFVIESAAAARRVAETVRTEELPQSVVLVVPALAGDAAIDDLTGRLAAAGLSIPVVRHHRSAPIVPVGGPRRRREPGPAIVLVDPWSVVRCVEDLFPGSRHLPGSIRHWTNVLRGRGE